MKKLFQFHVFSVPLIRVHKLFHVYVCKHKNVFENTQSTVIWAHSKHTVFHLSA